MKRLAALLLATPLCAAAFTDEDRRCLVQTVYHEAHAKADMAARLAIVQVVVARRQQGYAPSICRVVHAPHQFSWARRPARMHGVRLEKARDAVAAYEIGARDPTTKRATHFHATYVRPGWARRMKPLATRGGHHFYKLREN